MDNQLSETQIAREAITDMLWLWAALFDGPPPEAVWVTISHSVLPPIAEALQRKDLESVFRRVSSEILQAEYNDTFCIPIPGSPYSLYDEDSDPDELASLWQLAGALELPWKKEQFVPGRAYPISPDHLSVLFALLAIIMGIPQWSGTDVLGKAPEFWVNRLLRKIDRILSRLTRTLPETKAYRAIAELAYEYSKHTQEWAMTNITH